jgi:uncharacterized protein YegJ (DUF2314 family)
MTIEPGILLAVACGIGVWIFMRWKSPRPDFPPLNTSPDDPLMIEALEKATRSLAEFQALVAAPNQHAFIKLRFVSSSEQVEYLWAEVVEVLSNDEFDVRLVTPPVTHSGSLDRLWRCTPEDIVDWQVRDTNGKIHGGFSQRAMFAIARRDGVKLPRRLLEIEKEYIDA